MRACTGCIEDPAVPPLSPAQASFRSAIDVAPSYRLAHTNLGVVLREQGNLAGAEQSFREADLLDPTPGTKVHLATVTESARACTCCFRVVRTTDRTVLKFWLCTGCTRFGAYYVSRFRTYVVHLELLL